MEDIQVQNISKYDIEFMNTYYMNNDNINEVQDNQNPPVIYNPALFQIDELIQFFQNKNIIMKNAYCTTCGKICNL